MNHKNNLESLLQIEGISLSTLSGGSICESFKLETKNGDTYFVKYLSNNDNLLAESRGLEQLAKCSHVKVPKVIKQENNYLVLEFVEEVLEVDQKQWGRYLAQLHNQILGNSYGNDFDNYIGRTPQINANEDDWAYFFFRHRLLFQVELTGDTDLKDKLMKCEKIIFAFLFHKPKASLVHGDLWSGNIFQAKDRVCLFDPATYYGDHEVDLAMTMLFGGFDPDFYLGYNEVAKISSEFKFREKIYNLYHILNHYNLFGASYKTQAIGLLDEISRF